MKDYTQLEGLCVNEWENDEEWLSHRLQFIWDFRTIFPEQYLTNGMSKELQSGFYSLSMENVIKKAQELERYTSDEVKRFESMHEFEIRHNYEKLKSMPMQELMKRENRQLYIFIVEIAKELIRLEGE